MYENCISNFQRKKHILQLLVFLCIFPLIDVDRVLEMECLDDSSLDTVCETFEDCGFSYLRKYLLFKMDCHIKGAMIECKCTECEDILVTVKSCKINNSTKLTRCLVKDTSDRNGTLPSAQQISEGPTIKSGTGNSCADEGETTYCQKLCITANTILSVVILCLIVFLGLFIFWKCHTDRQSTPAPHHQAPQHQVEDGLMTPGGQPTAEEQVVEQPEVETESQSDGEDPEDQGGVDGAGTPASHHQGAPAPHHQGAPDPKNQGAPAPRHQDAANYTELKTLKNPQPKEFQEGAAAGIPEEKSELQPGEKDSESQGGDVNIEKNVDDENEDGEQSKRSCPKYRKVPQDDT